MKGRALLAPLVLFLAPLGGCTGGGPGYNCTLIGGTSGVTFRLDAIVKNAHPPVRATACVEGKCVPASISSVPAPTIIVVEDSSLTSERPVMATLTVFATDRQIFNSSTTVLLHKSQPNGPHCEPTLYVASVRATKAGGLVAKG